MLAYPQFLTESQILMKLRVVSTFQNCPLTWSSIKRYWPLFDDLTYVRIILLFAYPHNFKHVTLPDKFESPLISPNLSGGRHV